MSLRGLVLPLSFSLAACASPLVDGTAQRAKGAAGTELAPSAAIADLGPPGPDGAVPACRGVLLDQDRTYDVQLRSVVVRGDLTVDGSAPSQVGGSILLVDPQTHQRFAAPVRAFNGQGRRYELTVAPGTYDVYYVVGDGACSGAADAPGSLPCNSGRVRHKVGIAADTWMSLDLQTVRVTGSITAQHDALPDATSDRGDVLLRQHGIANDLVQPFVIHLGNTGAVSYATRLLAGIYDARFHGADHFMPGSLVCGGGVLEDTRLLAVDDTWNLDVSTAQATGIVKADGRPLTSRPLGHGQVVFVSSTGDRCAVDVPVAGEAKVAAPLLLGTYDVFFRAAPGDTPSDQLPRIGGRLHHDLALTSDVQLPLDVARVTVSGSITVVGAQLVDQTGERGTVYFRNVVSGEALGIVLGSTGRGGYSLRVMPGTYEVSFFGPSDLCVGTQLPCGGGIIEPALVIGGETTHDVDIPVVTITGTIRANGAALSDQASDRGAILLHRPDYYVPARLELGNTGAATYSARIMPGTYDVQYVAADTCPAVSSLPCNSGILKQKLTVAAAGVLDIDVPVFNMAGSVTLNGVGLHNQPYDRGRVVLQTPRDILTPSDLNVPHNQFALELGQQGTFTYATRLVATDYVVSYQSRSGCDVAQAPDGTTPPCTGQVLLGCSP